MAKNVGSEDRGARIVMGVGLLLLVFFAGMTPTAQLITGIVAAYLVLTGIIQRCFIYKIIDVDTTIQEQPYSDTDDRSGL